jgi:hypothetical protein
MCAPPRSSTMFLLGITALIIAGVVEWIGSLLR